MSNRALRQGLVMGLIAYAAVALFYAGFDLVASRGPLYTVDLLGKALLRGVKDPSILQLPIKPDLTAMFWYNGFHLVASLMIGLIVRWLVDQSGRRYQWSPWFFLVIVGGYVTTIWLVGSLSTHFRSLLPWWSIVAANSVAVLLAGYYLIRREPAAWQRLFPFAS